MEILLGKVATNLKSKVVTKEEALTKFSDGQTIMFGDWHGELSAEEIITGMLEKGVKDIDAIAVSGGMPDQGLGRLISEHRVKSLITTHIGLNPVARDQMFAGELAVEFVPQGTFAERIRCGGAGFPDTLPAVLADFLSGDPAACRAFAAAQPSGRNLRAAAAALRGADPARGAVFFAVSDAVPSEVRASGRIRFESGGYAFWQ